MSKTTTKARSGSQTLHFRRGTLLAREEDRKKHSAGRAIMWIKTHLRSGARNEAGFTMVELMLVLAFLGVVACIAINTAFYAFDASRLGKTVGDMRGLSDAIMRYQSDSSSLPGGGLQPVSAIAPLLRPSAGQIIPMKDGWDHDL